MRFSTRVAAHLLSLTPLFLAGGIDASARDIEIDEVTLSGEGQREGRAALAPWSGYWYPMSSLTLSQGINGTGEDFRYDEAAKRWVRANPSKPVADLSPLLKYDEYVRLTTGTDPQAALLECTGDDANDFEHSVYGDKKKKYDDEGTNYGWWGHCNGWAASAVMEQEPMAPIEARGIRFDVGDQKALLAESYWGVESDFTGRRYNLPPDHIKVSRQPGTVLLAALNANTPKPVAEYIAWYEKAWQTTMNAASRAAAKPADFRDELETFDRWYVQTYDDAFKDIEPSVFHRILETVMGRKKLALVMDMNADEQVWNFPAFAFRSNVTLSRSFNESGAARKEWNVATTVWWASALVPEAILGVKSFSKDYTYKLVTDGSGRLLRGEWTGASVNDHPDFAWLPTNNPTGADYGENYKLLYGKILEILPVAHRMTDARAVDLTANGTRASTRRAHDKASTWTQPVVAGGDVSLSVAVASGRAVARVKYVEQLVTGSTDITASRSALVPLGESATGPSFGSTVRFSSNGKKLVNAYAYDASGRLLGIDEIALQYTTTGGGGVTPSVDDAFEQNDTQATASPMNGGSYPNLQCSDDDWYKVTVGAGGSVSFRIDFQHSEGDLDMELMGPAGQIAKSDSTANQESVSGSGLAAGTYLARVHGYSGASARYALTVTVAGQSGGGSTGTDDSYEPNNARAAASSVAAGSFPGLKCNDDDWFKVTLATPGNISVRIDFRNAEGDLDLVLEGPSGAQIAKSETTADSEQVSGTNLAAGTYYVRAFGYSGARAAYSMTVTTSSTSSGGGSTTTRTGTVTASALNVRTGPGNTHPVVTTVPNGRVVTILQETASWYRVTWSGAPAAAQLWVSRSYVRLN